MLLPSFNSSHVLIGVLELSSAILAANAFSKNTATGNGDLARGNAAFGFQINKLSALPTSHRRHRRKSCRLGLSKSGSDVDSDEANCHSNTLKNGHVHGRRSMLHYVGLSLAGTVSSGPLSALLRAFGDDDSAVTNAGPANAMGLVQFPCPAGTLANTYHMMRAGESGLEAMDILSTNPLFLTNREDALTDLGTIQVEEVCSELMSKGVNPSVVKYSLASKCIDTANIIAATMMVGRNRIIPEFTFMDPRGAGLWDGKSLQSTEAAIWALDVAEAGDEGRGGKPPPNDDGTANETLFEQVTRLRQLMSVLETQYSGDDILLIFPDGTSPALLSCLIAGIPLYKCHALNYSPGEVRLDVNMDSSLQLMDERLSSAKYNDMLSVGQEQLVSLRNEPIEEMKPKAFVPESLKTKKETSDRKSRVPSELAATLAIEEKKKTSDVPDIFSTGAICAMGYIATYKGPKEETNDEEQAQPKLERNPGPNFAYANSTGISPFEYSAPYASVNSNMNAGPALNTVSTIATNVLDADVGLLNPNLFEDVPVLSKEDRIVAATVAMEEYMNKDDGGGAWLDSMKDMMGED